MKKTLIVFGLLFFANFVHANAQEALNVANQSGCSVNVVLYAHDNGCNGTACGTYRSAAFTVNSANTASFNAEVGASDAACTASNHITKWFVGGVNTCYLPACMPSGSTGWDAADIIVPGAGTITIGPSTGSCGASTSGNICCDCSGPGSTVYASWIGPFSGVFTIVIHN